MNATRGPVVYCAFNAVGAANPSQSDIRYFNLLKAWNRRTRGEPAFVDSHALRFSFAIPNRRERLQAELEARLSASDLLLVLLTRRSAMPGSWLPWEVHCALERYRLPVLCVYPEGRPAGPLPGAFLPVELAGRLGGPFVEHLPFRKRPVFAALSRWRGRGHRRAVGTRGAGAAGRR